ncbi:LAFE_0G02542g1_1 [Lachancea fermentati]|uniref:DNA polymerase epsilon catalytic subunit n=1 Tax=Lachancea fermentati TaxID=4955 RepID=A0A1G4MH45_LACFM|nr:LAFE_0G02542g1_1 [Lachancea fermentati]
MATRFQGSTTARYVGTGGSLKNNIHNNVTLTAQQLMDSAKLDEIDSMMGFERYVAPQYGNKTQLINEIPGRIGWLVNMHPTVVSQDVASNGGKAPLTPAGISGVDFYFLDEEGGGFKSTLTFDPYFLISCKDESRTNDVEEYLKKYLEHCLKDVEVITRNDLSMTNHLVGLERTMLKLSFTNNNNLFEARKLLRPILRDNESNQLQRALYSSTNTAIEDTKMLISDMREYDVPYHVRVSIDNNIRVGKWYKVTSRGFLEVTEKVAFADPVVLAFDIETTKPPLKFPDASIDQIMMISYMIDGEGYLITNREIISEDIDDFEYTPKPEYPGQFTIFNEADELALLQRFFEHIRDVRPTVISTFNGDFFDWPFVDTRSKIHGLNMYEEIGFAPDSEGEYKSSYCAHMDCYRWVKRDSYLPQGSQGLKAVTQAKLGYNPIELDPELMTPYAYEKPQHLSEYSVSDAVATYYLYMKYVHPFIFSLCTIIPLNPDEVLRKGTGTLCEMLLMVQAYNGQILLPNKHTDPIERFYDGHLLESETYVGGHVESLEAGVFRSDIKNNFKIDPTAIDELLEDLPNALKFCIEVENKAKLESVTNFENIKDQITQKLLDLKENSDRNELPLIYHVDVASMYPNIMVTNRLQPDSVKTDRDCASCDFNRPGKTCDRRLNWAWRGEFFPAKLDEYNMVKRALQNETFPNKNRNSNRQFLTFEELSYSEQVAQIKKRLTDYSKKVYHRVKASEVVQRTAIICQRENPFYVNTVRSFRDRRYEFKGLAKTWKKKLSDIDLNDKHERDEAKKMIVLYDSLQLAHKVILNSFYGYVMRKGSRWYSMEMAGITCLTGATIIQMARSLVERIGRPLELDTDGIWCIIPKSFPDNFIFELDNGKKIFLSYPCSMLNYRVHCRFTNHQYQTLVDPIKHKYQTHSDNSIFFEVDGPYKAMILPTSKEEGKGIKKRYAVFNEDGSLAELKGFELKRRGELQLIKNFQSDIFKVFLEGNSLEACYAAVASVANRWLDVLDTKGAMLEDEDLIALICENRSMSKTLKEYEGQKSTSITTARRLGEFLGEEMVKDKGLQCKYIISSKPLNAPVTERAIPVAIFSADLSVKRSFLRRWLMDSSLENFDPRAIIDWDYYRERLASVVQKIITIPAALQNIKNPVPRVNHPDWLQKRIAVSEDKFKQTSLTKFFKKTKQAPVVKDIEDTFLDSESADNFAKMRIAKITTKKKAKRRRDQGEEEQNLTLPSEMPSMDEDYIGWLNYQKIKWKIQARDRKRRTQLFGNAGSVSHRSTLGNILRKHAESYANSTWEILEYKETSEPGVLDVYVQVNRKVHTLKFKMSKSVYMNFKTNSLPNGTIENCLVEKSTSVLPNDRSLNDKKNSSLFKLTLPEEVYLDEIQNPSSVLNHESVLGIFESSVNSIERAIIELGSSVGFSSNAVGALGRGLQKGFESKHLHMVDEGRYLEQFYLEPAYLLHLSTNIGYEFFVLYRSWDKKLEVFVLKPSESAQNLSVSMLESIYEETYLKKVEKLNRFYDLIKFSENIHVDYKPFTDLPRLYKRLSASIGKLSDEKGSQVIVLLQSPFAKKLRKTVKPFLQMPVIEISMAETVLPQLKWQEKLVNLIVNHVLSLGPWLKNLISLSRYSNIPLCNLNLEKMSYVIDIMYARNLKKQDIVLWWNGSNPLPDHGGVEKDFNPLMASLMTDLEAPVFNNPEIYDSVVLEIDINNLTVNTVLSSALINEAEGSDLADMAISDNGNEDNKLTGLAFVEDSFSNAALGVLRSLLKQLWDDALTDNITADSLVHTFINWIYAPDSKLFDYSLRYHVHNLTKKALLQLINVCKCLGSSVVFANRNKLYLKTSKTTVENSYAYGQYLTKAVRTTPMFHYLDLSICRYWDLLIWMDIYNYGGRACSKIEEREDQKLTAYSKWHIKNFLPIIYQQEFDDWMIIILDSMIKAKESYYESNTGTQRLTQIPPVRSVSGTAQDGDEVDPLAGFTVRFGQPMAKRMSKLLKNQQEFILDPTFGADYAFPMLPGSHIKMRNPLLELVKELCHIMMLSKKRTLEVRTLRKQLLKIFEIGEFDWESEFRDPSSSLVVVNLICEYCSSIDDVDFCKKDGDRQFQCQKCHKPYDTTLLQEHLVQSLQTEVEAFFLQDLKCKKCGRVKENSMSNYCPCSGEWKTSVSRKSLASKLEIFKNVSHYYNFELLLSVIDDLL